MLIGSHGDSRGGSDGDSNSHAGRARGSQLTLKVGKKLSHVSHSVSVAMSLMPSRNSTGVAERRSSSSRTISTLS